MKKIKITKEDLTYFKNLNCQDEEIIDLYHVWLIEHDQDDTSLPDYSEYEDWEEHIFSFNKITEHIYELAYYLVETDNSHTYDVIQLEVE